MIEKEIKIVKELLSRFESDFTGGEVSDERIRDFLNNCRYAKEDLRDKFLNGQERYIIKAKNEIRLSPFLIPPSTWLSLFSFSKPIINAQIQENIIKNIALSELQLLHFIRSLENGFLIYTHLSAKKIKLIMAQKKFNKQIGIILNDYPDLDFYVEELGAKKLNLLQKLSLIQNFDFKAEEDDVLVISTHPIDIITCSVNNFNWSSCFSPDGLNSPIPFGMAQDEFTMIVFVASAKNYVFDNGEETYNKKWRQFWLYEQNEDILFENKAYPHWSDFSERISNILGYTKRETRSNNQQMPLAFDIKTIGFSDSIYTAWRKPDMEPFDHKKRVNLISEFECICGKCGFQNWYCAVSPLEEEEKYYD
jgi:hypothetical protein